MSSWLKFVIMFVAFSLWCVAIGYAISLGCGDLETFLNLAIILVASCFLILVFKLIESGKKEGIKLLRTCGRGLLFVLLPVLSIGVIVSLVMLVGSIRHGRIWWQHQANPPQMVEKLVTESLDCLDQEGNWTKVSQGRKAYNRLESANPEYVIESLVSRVKNAEIRKKVLFLAVKLGTPGSEKALTDALLQQGDKSMAEDYLNCGSAKLEYAGRMWGEKHGYSITQGAGSHRVNWGQF